ncbi:retinol dehydrogenase 12-like [Chrysoperla carnea]|uniref:retinol dehydrogenase 12-like n=1 Tax=Chrysoperla carnea TaxID=189513 RepID=UPI001D0775EB|nr:retinol dehydrogenase 12-like [Chrysoperla carnea]
MKYTFLIEFFLGSSVFGIILYQLKKYKSGSDYKCCSSKINGLNIIVTGATTLIGKATALELAQRGAYFLTYLLLDLLKNSKSAKIINIPSQCHYVPKFRDVEEIIGNHILKRCHIKATSVSKLALLAFTFHLSEELKETNVSVYAVDPGNCEKQVFPKFPKLTNPVLFILNTPIHSFIVKSSVDAAQSIIHTLLSNFPTGSFILDYQQIPFSSLAKDIRLFDLLQETIINSCKIPSQSLV